MFSQKRILICPLDWGLGHATRCIPVIRLLLKKKSKVVIAADGRPLELLKKEFPDLEFVVFKGYNITYPNSGSMVLKMLLSIPKIFIGIYNEHNAVKKICKEKNIDVIISDNRFGCWNKKIKSIFITHQLMIKVPFMEKLLYRINLFFIKKYDECWVPDVEGANNLSGDLSHKYTLPKNVFFVGVLSRFSNVIAREVRPKQSLDKTDCFVPINIGTRNDVYDVMAIISGPEPQRTVFEKLILGQLKQTNLKALVVCGKSELEQKSETIENIEIISHLKADEMQQAILNSKIIIARSGYSTIMDIVTLGKKAIFVPTPGQTEQEYLAESLMKKNSAYSSQQKWFTLTKALKESENYKGFQKIEKGDALEKRIDQLCV